MLRQVVDSQSLRSIGYDKRTGTLEVEFRTGGLYRYASVPVELWSDFLQAKSKGQFFQERVRDHFPTTRLD
jgi:hypothetical protein